MPKCKKKKKKSLIYLALIYDISDHNMDICTHIYILHFTTFFCYIFTSYSTG